MCGSQKMSDFVLSFCKELYNSKFELYNCEELIETAHENICIIDKEFQDFCESDITTSEIKDALFGMEKMESTRYRRVNCRFLNIFGN